MSILMVLIGATIGATIGSLFMHWRKDVAKERQQLESKTPYDYALTNARADNNRYRGELFTIKALKRTEADTERIRNEIDTILSDDGEEATESVYDVDKAFMDSTDLTFRQYWDVLKTTDGLDTSPMSAITGMSTEQAAWDATSVSRAYANANVREDVSKDEQSAEDDVERSYNHNVRQAFRDRTFVRVLCTGGMVAGEITTIAFEYGELTELQLNGVDISIPAIKEIRKGDHMNGETLYRKGNR